MKTILPALLFAAVSLAMGSALAQSGSTADPTIERSTARIPQRDCVLKTLNACKADGSCAAIDNLKGEKLPVKVTVDLDTGIVAGVDAEGWVNATKIASLTRTTDQLILQGTDNTVAWQMLIGEKTPTMSLSLATRDGANIAFGDCTIAKEE